MVMEMHPPVGEMIEPPIKKAILPVVDEDYICKKVLELLGKPPNFYQITAGKVAKNAHRVNVWNQKPKLKSTGYLFPSYQICDSFYVKVSSEGIISSSPPIEPKY